MLIIALGKARRYTNNVIKEFLYLDELREENCLIEPDLEKFKQEYSKYINEVELYMNKRKIIKKIFIIFKSKKLQKSTIILHI